MPSQEHPAGADVTGSPLRGERTGCADRTSLRSVVRLAPLTDDELTDEQRALLSVIDDRAAHATNIFRTLVRHPGLFRRFGPFGGKLLRGRLTGRDRELLILRTAYNCRSAYEWAQHVLIAREAGLTDDEIVAVAAGPGAPVWSDHDRALLRAADELHADHRIGDETWAALRSDFDGDERLLIEVPMLVGNYTMLAFTLNTLGVPVEPGKAPLPD